MGYTHGTKWSNDLIKEKTFEVIKAYDLDRMPSRSEINQYFGDYKLSNAISKRFGWYELAKKLNLSIKKSETYFGKIYEFKAKELLESMGYEVDKMSQNFPYDLLINKCVKVDVKASYLYKGKSGNFYSFNLEKPYSTCDIYLLYLINETKETKDILIVPSNKVPTNTQISVGEKNSKYYKYSQQWDLISEYINFMESLG